MIIILRSMRPGRRCKLLRVVNNITAEIMAKKTLISKYKYSRFENGWCGLTDEEQQAVAQVLGVNREDLFSPVLKTQQQTEEDTL